MSIRPCCCNNFAPHSPVRGLLAETFLPWCAVRHSRDCHSCEFRRSLLYSMEGASEIEAPPAPAKPELEESTFFKLFIGQVSLRPSPPPLSLKRGLDSSQTACEWLSLHQCAPLASPSAHERASAFYARPERHQAIHHASSRALRAPRPRQHACGTRPQNMFHLCNRPLLLVRRCRCI